VIGLGLAAATLLAGITLQNQFLAQLPAMAADRFAIAGGTLAFVLSGAMLGASVGLVQRPIVRRSLPNARGWVAASAAGSAVAAGLAPIIGLEIPPLQQSVSERVVPGTLTVLVGGLIGGIAQWRILHRSVAAAGWWVGITSLAWLAGGLAFFGGFALLSNGLAAGVGPAIGIVGPLAAVVITVLGLGLLPACMTGLGLRRLVQQELSSRN
jgi:hypothetical protein